MKRFFMFIIALAIVNFSFTTNPENVIAKEYTGEKIVVNFYDADIKNVFKILKAVSKKNFAIDRNVTGRVTLSLEEPVPWDRVLDLVLKMNQLDKVFEGEIIRIATIEILKKETKFKSEKLSTEPLVTKYISINYSNAEKDIKPNIETILTERGSVSVDRRSNIIIIKDIMEKIKEASEIIKSLDSVTPQVIIEAKIVETSAAFSREIGSTLGTSDSSKEGDNHQYNANMALNFPVTSDTMSIGVNFVNFAGSQLLLNAKLMAMESRGEGKIVSAPKIITINDKEATIQQGIRYPYKVIDAETGITTTEFEEIDLILKVLPHVTSDNRILMSINIEKADLGIYYAGGQSFTTKSADTEVLVNDGDTLVIGGIIKTTESFGEKGVPWLSSVPVLGWFFKSKTKTNNKEDLLIFITPTIMRLEQR